jgi:hypothetical protein
MSGPPRRFSARQRSGLGSSRPLASAGFARSSRNGHTPRSPRGPRLGNVREISCQGSSRVARKLSGVQGNLELARYLQGPDVRDARAVRTSGMRAMVGPTNPTSDCR